MTWWEFYVFFALGRKWVWMENHMSIVLICHNKCKARFVGAVRSFITESHVVGKKTSFLAYKPFFRSEIEVAIFKAKHKWRTVVLSLIRLLVSWKKGQVELQSLMQNFWLLFLTKLPNLKQEKRKVWWIFVFLLGKTCLTYSTYLFLYFDQD